jgi:acetoin utilization deacetylase AcuC-like enzyme
VLVNFMPLAIVHHPDYAAELAAEHRFPMGKFRAVAEHLVAFGLAPNGFHQPEPAQREQLARAHAISYIDAVLACDVSADVTRRIGLPITPSVVRRSLAATGGTMLTANLALRHGIACNTAGGSHHAMREGGAGFCVFNDVAVAAHDLLARERVQRILVVDCDVHQGDGTAEIFSHDERVVTLSIHCAQNFPVRKQCSTIDVALERGAHDEEYLPALEGALRQAFARGSFDIVFYNAGVDPHRDDALGYLALSDEGLRARDRMVIEAAYRNRSRLAGVLGGGYSRDIGALARRHAILHSAAAEYANHPWPV